VLTLLGEMLDVARYGPHGGKLSLYVKVRTFDQLEQNKISVLNIISGEMVTLIVRYGMIVSVCSM
jgi:hypothetical protein